MLFLSFFGGLFGMGSFMVSDSRDWIERLQINDDWMRVSHKSPGFMTGDEREDLVQVMRVSRYHWR